MCLAFVPCNTQHHSSSSRQAKDVKSSVQPECLVQLVSLLALIISARAIALPPATVTSKLSDHSLPLIPTWTGTNESNTLLSWPMYKLHPLTKAREERGGGGVNHSNIILFSTLFTFVQYPVCQCVSAFEDGKWHILEPIMTVEVTAPEEFRSAVLENIMKRSAVIVGTDTLEGSFVIYCEVGIKYY